MCRAVEARSAAAKPGLLARHELTEPTSIRVCFGTSDARTALAQRQDRRAHDFIRSEQRKGVIVCRTNFCSPRTRRTTWPTWSFLVCGSASTALLGH